MTKKIRVTKAFKSAGKRHEPGDEVEMTDGAAENVIEMGHGEEIEEVGEIEDIEPADENEDSKNITPEETFFVGVSDSRNFRVKVFGPEFGKYDSPSVLLQESRKDDDGNWSDETFYLPTGASLLVLEKALGKSWERVQELRD